MGSLTIRIQEILRDAAFSTGHLLLRAYLKEISFHLNVVINWRFLWVRDGDKFLPLFSALGFQLTQLHAGPNHAASFSVSSRVI